MEHTNTSISSNLETGSRQDISRRMPDDEIFLSSMPVFQQIGFVTEDTKTLSCAVSANVASRDYEIPTEEDSFGITGESSGFTGESYEFTEEASFKFTFEEQDVLALERQIVVLKKAVVVRDKENTALKEELATLKAGNYGKVPKTGTRIRSHSS